MVAILIRPGEALVGTSIPGPLSVPPYHGENPTERQNNAARRNFIYKVLRKPGQENSLRRRSQQTRANLFCHAAAMRRQSTL